MDKIRHAGAAVANRRFPRMLTHITSKCMIALALR